MEQAWDYFHGQVIVFAESLITTARNHQAQKTVHRILHSSLIEMDKT